MGTEIKKVVKDSSEFHTNTNLPNIWIDTFHLAVRDDNVCVLRFYANLPEGQFEQARVVTTMDHLKKISDLIQTSIDIHGKEETPEEKPKKTPRPRVK